jgi:predicted nucleotidyltransferase
MKEQILEKLKLIEQQMNVKIIFAVESGSRAWGFPSIDSDYDVRCIHVSPSGKYLSLETIPEQISNVYDNIDIVSWDIKKFGQLFKKSNPSVSEWLNSDIIYLESFYVKKLLKLFQEGFSKYELSKHYVSMARANYEKYIRNKDVVSYKKYVYVLRSLACLEWVQQINTIPPLHWKNTLSLLPSPIQTEYKNIIKQKVAGENVEGPTNIYLNKFIENYFDKEFKKDVNNFDTITLNDIVKTIIVTQGINLL